MYPDHFFLWSYEQESLFLCIQSTYRSTYVQVKSSRNLIWSPLHIKGRKENWNLGTKIMLHPRWSRQSVPGSSLGMFPGYEPNYGTKVGGLFELLNPPLMIRKMKTWPEVSGPGLGVLYILNSDNYPWITYVTILKYLGTRPIRDKLSPLRSWQKFCEEIRVRLSGTGDEILSMSTPSLLTCNFYFKVFDDLYVNRKE